MRFAGVRHDRRRRQSFETPLDWSEILITRSEPTAPMRQEAKAAGQFKPENFGAFDRLQIVTVQEILDGARMNLPLMEEVAKRAQKAKKDNQTSLFES